MAKRKKMKRSHLKLWSSARVKTTSRHDAAVAHEMRTKLRPVEETVLLKLLNLSKLNPTQGMRDVIKKLNELADNKPMYNHILVHKGRLKRVYIMYNNKRDCNFIVEVNYALLHIRYSEHYHSIVRAKQNFMQGSIRWACTEPLPESATEGFIPPLPQ